MFNGQFNYSGWFFYSFKFRNEPRSIIFDFKYILMQNVKKKKQVTNTEQHVLIFINKNRQP